MSTPLPPPAVAARRTDRAALPLTIALGAAGLLLLGFAALGDYLRGFPPDFGTQQMLVGLAGAVLTAEAWLRLSSGASHALWSLVLSDRRAGFALAAVFALGIVGIEISAFHRYFVDDSYITFRYGRNLASGYGVAWNPGEPPVEGYSNFLWMLISAWAHRAGLDPMTVSRVVGGGCIVVSLFVVRRLAIAVAGTARWANLAMVLMAAIPSFAYWAMSGLETASVVLLSLLYFLDFHRDLEARRLPWRTALWADLLCLSRPDAPLLLALSAAPLLFSRDRAERAWLLRLVLAALPVVLIYQGWHWMTFGRLTTNTVAAKFRPLSGSELTINYFHEAFPLPLLALAGAIRGARLFERQMLLVGFGFLLVMLNVTPQVGHYNRFYLEVLAPMVVLVPLLASRWESAPPAARPSFAIGGTAGFAAFLLLLVQFAAPFREMVSYGEREIEGYSRAHEPIGDLLGRNFTPHELLAASDCGIIPYRSKMRTMDIWGLTDRRIAEKGFDAGYVMAAHPDAIVLHSYGRDDYQGREAYDVALYPALVADGSYHVERRFFCYGYWLWLFTKKPLH
jgi:hypothetical protein